MSNSNGMLPGTLVNYQESERDTTLLNSPGCEPPLIVLGITYLMGVAQSSLCTGDDTENGRYNNYCKDNTF